MDTSSVTPIPYGIKTLNGELARWRLRPRAIPMAEETPIVLKVIRVVQSQDSYLALHKKFDLEMISPIRQSGQNERSYERCRYSEILT
jgi:hypothetical protein